MQSGFQMSWTSTTNC